MINTLKDLYLNNRVGRSGIITDPMTVYSQITDFNEVDADGKNMLHYAVENLDLNGIHFLLEKETEIESDKINNNLLHTLSKSPYLANPKLIIDNEEAIYKIANLLLENKVKPKRKNDYEELSYVVATKKLAYPMVKALAESGLKMDAAMENGMNLMHFLLEEAGYNSPSEEKEKCLEEIIRALISSGLDPEDKDSFGYTPEFYAKNAHLNSIVAILQGNDDANSEEVLSLKEALNQGDYSLADKMLANGADINEVDAENNMTPLMWFSFLVNADSVKYLLDKGADVNFKEGSTGQTALSLFITNGYRNLRGKTLDVLPKVLKLICKSDIDLNNIIDEKGNTALNLLCKQKDMEGINTKLVEILIDQEVDMNIPDLEGLTPMMSFARYNGEEQSLNIIEALVDEDADVTHRDKFGNNVLHYAAMNERDNDAKKIAELVLDLNSEIANQTNNEGKTAIDIAIERGNEACTKAILMNM